MKCNLGQIDKYVRLMLGVMLFALGLYSERNFSGVTGQFLLWSSLFLLLTAAFSWCPFTWVRRRGSPRSADQAPEKRPADPTA